MQLGSWNSPTSNPSSCATFPREILSQSAHHVNSLRLSFGIPSLLPSPFHFPNCSPQLDLTKRGAVPKARNFSIFHWHSICPEYMLASLLLAISNPIPFKTSPCPMNDDEILQVQYPGIASFTQTKPYNCGFAGRSCQSKYIISEISDSVFYGLCVQSLTLFLAYELRSTL